MSYKYICNWCKKEYITNDRRRKYCGLSCAGKASGLKKRSEEIEKRTIKCFWCGKKTRNKKFCSRSCSVSCSNTGRKISDEHKRKISMGVRKKISSERKGDYEPIRSIICLECGNEFKPKRHHSYKFCSLSCSAKYRISIRNKEIEKTLNKNNKYGIRAIKTYLIWKNGNSCMNCGNSEWLGKQIPLELHHINGKSKDNNIDNLKLLCPNCHAFTDTYKSKNVNCDRKMAVYYHRKKGIVGAWPN